MQVSGKKVPFNCGRKLSTGLTTLTSRDKYPDFPRDRCALNVCTIFFQVAFFYSP